jgi:twitching motility protein PilT
MDLDAMSLLRIAGERNASDLHVSVGTRPMIRVHGDLFFLEEYPVLSSRDTEALVRSILSDDFERLEQVGEIDFSFGVPGVGRFRVNVFRQRGTYAMVARTIPFVIRSFDELNLPAKVLSQFCMKTKGLVLVTGPTGSGRSTTLASMIDYINQNRSCHVVTLEDPIEYLHKHGKSVINQREIGSDTQSFVTGLRASLREDPDVILVGVMPDLETIATAIQAAETGHLVLAAIRTNDCTQTVDRIIDVFPPYQQQQVRVQLSLALEGIISQQLVPTKDRSSRVAAVEVLVVNPAIRSLIREGRTSQIYSVIQTGGRTGMQTMEASLRDLVVSDKVSLEEASLRAPNPDEFRRLMRMG